MNGGGHDLAAGFFGQIAKLAAMFTRRQTGFLFVRERGHKSNEKM